MKKLKIASFLVVLCAFSSLASVEASVVDTQIDSINLIAQNSVDLKNVDKSVKPLKPSQKAKYENLCNKALSLIEQNKYEQAESIIDKAFDITADLDMAYALRGRVLQRQNIDSVEAVEFAQKALAINPNNYIANNIVGNQYYGNGDYSTALEYFNKSIAVKPDYTPCLHNLFLIYYSKFTDYSKAVDALSKEIQYSQNKEPHVLIDLYSLRANLYNMLEKYDLAIQDANTALLYDKNNYLPYLLLGTANSHKGNYKDAIKFINKSVKLSEGKNEPEVYLTRARIYKMMNYDYNMVANDFIKAEQFAGNDVSKLYRLVLALDEYNQDDEIIRVVNKILSIDPEHKKTLILYVGSLINCGEFESAKTYLEKINIEELNDDENIMYSRFSALIKTGLAGLNDKNLLNQAIADLKKAYDLNNKSNDLLYFIGNCYFILGDYRNAYDNYSKFLENNYKATNIYDYSGVYKYLLLKKLTSYNNFETKNGKRTQVWDVPDWVTANPNFEEFRWASVANELHDDLAGRINYSNAVYGIDDKNYYLKTINMLKTYNGNIGKVYNLHINNDSITGSSGVMVYPYVNALDKNATVISDSDYNLLLANQYFLLIKNSIENTTLLYTITEDEVSEFFDSLSNIPKATAVNLINEIAYYGYSDSNFMGSEGCTLYFYSQMLSYLNDNNLLNYSKTIKNNVKYAYLFMGDYLLKYDDVEGAIVQYNNAVPYGVSKFDINEFVGNHYFDDEEYFKASEYYTKALMVKASADVYLSRGQARTHLHDYDGAVADFNKAIGYNKNLAEAYWERAQVLFDQKKYSSALNDFIKYSTMNKDSAAALYNAGICLYNTGKKREALPYMERAKNTAQRVGDQNLYNASVRFINQIKGYNRGWY